MAEPQTPEAAAVVSTPGVDATVVDTNDVDTTQEALIARGADRLDFAFTDDCWLEVRDGGLVGRAHMRQGAILVWLLAVCCAGS